MSAWQHYQAYGDLGTLRTCFPAMRGYFDYLTSKASGSLLDYGYGDWASTDSSTPVGIAATYAYYRDAVALGAEHGRRPGGPAAGRHRPSGRHHPGEGIPPDGRRDRASRGVPRVVRRRPRRRARGSA